MRFLYIFFTLESCGKKPLKNIEKAMINYYVDY